MSRLVIIVLVLLTCTLCVAVAQSDPQNEEAAIRRVLDSYVEAFDKNDAAALSRLWTEEAQYEDETGEIYKGRKEIQEAFKQFFSESKGIRLSVSIVKVDLSSHGRAVVEGTSTVSVPGEEGSESDFAAQLVKKDGTWQIASVGEASDSPNYRNLRELDWLIGEWVDEKNAGRMETVAQWTANKNFITMSFAIQTNDINVEGTQVIGWDPVNKTIKSWTFDSIGGVAEGVLVQAGFPLARQGLPHFQ